GDRVHDSRYLARMRDPDRVADGDFVRPHVDERGGYVRDHGRGDVPFEWTAEGRRHVRPDGEPGGGRARANRLVTGKRPLDSLVDVLAAERLGRGREDRDGVDLRLDRAFESREVRDESARTAVYRPDPAVARGPHGQLHLHRFEDDQDVPLLDGVAGGDLDLDDGRRHRRGQRTLGVDAAPDRLLLIGVDLVDHSAVE